MGETSGTQLSNTRGGSSASSIAAYSFQPSDLSSVRNIFASLQSDLERVEKRMCSLFASDAPALSEISRYLLDLGGKRVRPVIALLAARLFGMRNASHELIDVAAGIELIHMATLLHDDIIDESPTRRRQASAYRKYGLIPSLLAGDFLLVRAFGVCAQLDEYIVQATERACVELTEGELLEGKLSVDRHIELEEYIRVIGKKTASLFALAAESGAYLAEVEQQTVQAMRRFGYSAGITFQIVDDILDITADEDLLGKPVGTDLRQRTPSIINVLWLQSGDPVATDFFARENVRDEDYYRAVSYLRESSIVEQSRALACDYASRATSTLRELCEAPGTATSTVDKVREELQSLIDYTLHRCL